MANVVYLYEKCSTCKDAQSFLEKNQIPFIRREIVETPPNLNDLRRMLEFMQGDLKKLFNTSGMFYREMQLNEKLKTMSIEEALELLSNHGMLVKRPFFLGDKVGLLGFKVDSWTKSLL